MKSKAALVFEGDAVLELLTHARTAPKHVSPYGLTANPGPGLMLVKDDGIYLMSNGEPGLPGADTVNKVAYARGYKALPISAPTEERMIRYDKVKDAVGGDDFAEFLPAGSFEKLTADGIVRIELTASKMTICIIGGKPNQRTGTPPTSK